jgi:hypothetical protein
VIGAFAKDRGDSVTIDSGDSEWLCAPGATCGTVSDDDTSASAASVTTLSGFPGGLAGHVEFDVTSGLDLRAKQLLHYVIYASPGAAAGGVSLVFDDSVDCRSPLVTLPLTGLDAGTFTDRLIQFTGADTLSSVACVGVVVPAGAHQVLIDQLDTGTSQFGPVVVPIQAGRTLTFKNHWPLPHGDSHFYYFLAPAGASSVSIKAQASGKSETRTDLAYCGAIGVTGSGTFEAEINAMHLWSFDPAQPLLPFQLTLLPLDSHQLIAAIPAASGRRRAVKQLALPPSPTGVYAVSIEGAANYNIKLSFD